VRYIPALDASGAYWGQSRAVATTHVHFANSQVDTETTALCEINGKPAVAYFDNGAVMFCQAADVDGQVWNAAVAVGTYGYEPSTISLLEVAGNPAIAYVASVASPTVNYSAGFVRALDADGATWGTPVLPDPTEVSEIANLIIDDGNPAIAYIKVSPGNSESLCYLRAADAAGSSWGVPQTIEAGLLFSTPVLADEGSGPCVAVAWKTMDQTMAGVHVVGGEPDGLSWNTPQVYATGDGFYYVWSMAFVNGGLYLAYTGSGSGLQILPNSGFVVDHIFPQGRASILNVGGQIGIAYQGCRQDYQDLLYVLQNGMF